MVVIHDKHPNTAQIFGGCQFDLIIFGLTDEHRRKGKTTPLARLAGYPDVSTHEPGKFTADGQTKAGASVFSCCGAIGLGEGIENGLQTIRCKADPGILHRKTQADLFFVRQFAIGIGCNGDGNFSILGELECITCQIDENLSQAHRVAQQGTRGFFVNGNEKFQLLFKGRIGKHFRKIGHNVI